MPRPVISVIIPNYNGRSLLDENLPLLFTALQSGDEVLIVDDASTDDSVATLIQQFRLEEKKLPIRPEVSEEYVPHPRLVEFQSFQTTTRQATHKITITLLALKKNQRFAGAVNIGAAYAQHHLFFLCNSDVVPAPDALERAARHFNDSDLFAVGCKEFDGDDRHHPAGKNLLWFERGLFIHSKAIDFSSGPTAWASGGSAVVAADKWFALQGFDMRFYPAYWEDIDLSFRARQRGWKVIFDAEAVVYHKHESTNGSVFGQQAITQMSWKNAFAFTWKQASLLQRIQFSIWLPYWLWKRYV